MGVEAVRIVVTDNMGEVVEAIEAALEGVSDFRPFWEQLRAAWEESRRAMYRTNGRSTDAPWRDYTDEERARYVPMKAAVINVDLRRIDQTILRWDGIGDRLRPSLENTRHPLAVYIVRPESLTLGTIAPGAGNHEWGQGTAPAKWGGYRIPRRRILAFGRAFAVAASVELGRFAASVGTRRAGFSSRELGALLRRGRG
jgi:hypothetical protein